MAISSEASWNRESGMENNHLIEKDQFYHYHDRTLLTSRFIYLRNLLLCTVHPHLFFLFIEHARNRNSKLQKIFFPLSSINRAETNPTPIIPLYKALVDT